MAYRVLLQMPYVRVWFSGTLTGADLREVAGELRAHERELGRVPDRLVDMSAMVATDTTFNLAILAARVRGVQRFPNAFRSALVAPTVAVAGFARIFRILNRNPQIEVHVFEDVDAAERWLSQPS
ncbi:MAG: STAS/SEC14 domain-containing protein [Gemmatimonadetes bacterium]|nr:STAS/SEC14 domain-containing protein [Gemmatimonadota bacterium]MBL0178275.1 STAS/SEC14 domain-containing protein [Gemmatimonadota bacterium]